MFKIVEHTSTEIVINKSRFIALSFTVTEAAEVKCIIKNLKVKYSDATHICYGFVVGKDGEVAGCSDDGEPAGTAGKPILEIIKRSNFTNLLIAVVRFFGGVKLGTGGLVHAYGGVTKELLASSKAEELVDKVTVTISFDYGLYNQVKRELENSNAKILSEVFLEVVSMQVELVATVADKIILALNNLTSGLINIKY